MATIMNKSIRLTQSQREAGWMLSEECGYRPGKACKEYSPTTTIVVEREGRQWCRYLLINQIGDGRNTKFKTLKDALEF